MTDRDWLKKIVDPDVDWIKDLQEFTRERGWYERTPVAVHIGDPQIIFFNRGLRRCNRVIKLEKDVFDENGPWKQYWRRRNKIMATGGLKPKC